MTSAKSIAVVGVGLSGLTAAYLLHQNGVPVTVFEASQEVGGHVKDRPIASIGAIAELGAQWVGDTQTAILGLMRHFKTVAYPSQPSSGATLNWFNLNLSAKGAPSPEFYVEIDRLSEQLEPTHPWTHPQAPLWDQLSVKAWLEKHANPLQQFLAQMELSSIISGD